MGKNSAFEMSFLLSQGFSPAKWMFFALFTDDWTPSAKGITRSALVFVRYVVSERRLYASGATPEPYSGRALLNSCENPASRKPKLGGYRSSINGLWP